MTKFNWLVFNPWQELKQDISSFRYEVLGMMKGTISDGGLGQESNIRCSAPENQFTPSPTFPTANPQGKIHLFNSTSTILQSATETSTSQASTKLANNPVIHKLVPLATEVRLACSDYPNDMSDLGQKNKCPDHSSQVFPVSDEPGGSDEDQRDCNGGCEVRDRARMSEEQEKEVENQEKEIRPWKPI